MSFASIGREPGYSIFIAKARRISDERRAVHATEPQRFVSLNAVALGAAFHPNIQTDSGV
jgi:hypothetical protein